MAKKVRHPRARSEYAWMNASRVLQLPAFTQDSRIRLRGDIGSFALRITGSQPYEVEGQSVREPTEYVLELPSAIPLTLSIRNEDFVPRFVRLFRSDIVVGDRGFDRQIYVKGSEERRVIDFLTPARRDAILDLDEAVDFFILSPTRIWAHQNDWISSAEQIIDIVQRMLHLAGLLHEEDQEARGADVAPSGELRGEFEPNDEPAGDPGLDVADAWLVGGETRPEWMTDQGVRLEDKPE